MTHGNLWYLPLLLSLCSCGPLTLNLRYAPADAIEVESIAGPIIEVPIHIAAVTDKRKPPLTQVGSTRQGQGDVLVSSSDDVTKFVRTALVRELKAVGGNIRTKAPTELHVEVVKLWVGLGRTYVADVSLRVRVTYLHKQVGTVIVRGTDWVWGRSQSSANYIQALCGAVLDAMANLISSAEFADLLGKHSSVNVSGAGQAN